MASEETGLNAALEAAGCEVTETDLGEWIIQVARETPSHIIVPAIHRDRHQIAEVLSRVAGGDLSSVPEELAAFARERLRRKFLEAELGVSGVNFGIAETGTCVLVTNEGNGRLVTSVPRVHVAIMGMERVLDSWAQLDLFLALLPRAATGQAITTYTSFLTGPRRAGEVDGPEEFHLVILDNGRSEILGSEFEEMLACIRCGACLNVCPVYRQVGGHAYGWVYSGPMGAVLTPLLLRAEGAEEVSQASSLCGACWQACPVGIPLQDLLLALRRGRRPGAVERAAWAAWAAAWSRPAVYRASLRAGRMAGALAGVGLRRWTADRDLPAVPARTFRELWESGEV
jgi:L-lactate dehydrogenase complex protein LldF